MEKQKTPYLTEVDWAILFFLIAFFSVLGGIRAYEYFTKQSPLDPALLTQPPPKKTTDPSTDIVEPKDPKDPTEEKNPNTELPTKWTYFTEEIEIRGDQIVCKEADSERYETFSVNQCLGRIEVEEENSLRKKVWLEFPNRKRVLWEDAKVKEDFEKSASLEVLYKIDYAKYSGNVQEKEEDK